MSDCFDIVLADGLCTSLSSRTSPTIFGDVQLNPVAQVVEHNDVLALCIFPFCCASAGQRLDTGFIVGQFACLPRIDDAAIVQNVCVVGNLQTHSCILLNQQHRNSFASHL